VLANPKVMVTIGKTSVIDLTSDYVESTTSQVIQGNGITNAVQKTYTIADDNGMKISLIPFISPDGYVSMNLKLIILLSKNKLLTLEQTVKLLL
jgi:type II secretory pathway component HofQ